MQHQNFEFPERNPTQVQELLAVFVYIPLMELATSNWMHNLNSQIIDRLQLTKAFLKNLIVKLACHGMI